MAKVSKVTGRKPAAKRGASARTMVLVSTRKGAWLYRGDAGRRNWDVDGPHFLGHIVNHMVLDPRDRRTLLAAAKTGHLGPTIFRSTDLGRTWKEAKKPPAFAKSPEGMRSRSVDHTFWLTPAHANEPDVWYAGTSPQGLFRSEDGGVTWEPFSNFHDDPKFRDWFGSEQDGTPRAQAAFDPDRPARPQSPLLRHVRRRRSREPRQGEDMVDPGRRPRRGRGLRCRQHRLPRSALRAHEPG